MKVIRALFATAILALPWTQAQAQPSKPLKIGAVVSLTGPASAFAKDWAQGFEAFVSAWNAKGGYQGRKVVLEMLDDETNPTSAVNAYRRLVSDPETTVVWLAVPAQTAVGIKALAGEFKVPTISHGGLEALGKPAEPWYFKLAGTAPDFARAIMNFANQKGFRRIAILTPNDANGQAEAAGVKAAIESLGMTLVSAESYAPADTNFNAQLTKIRNARPDFFYNGATGNPAILAYRQAKQLQINVPIAMSVAGVTAAFFKSIGGTENAEGLVSALPLGGVSGALSPEGERQFKELEAALKRPAVPFHAFGWETGAFTEWGLRNSNGTRQGLRDALEKAKDVPSINGPITFTPDNHIGQDIRGVAVAVMKGGKWVKAQ
jgi:branched-chain amino acid transport system substrate-binding protein